jgi:hypothetical protein
MNRFLIPVAVACLAFTPIAAASELTPNSAQSVHLAGVTGIVYYTVEDNGYKIVATLASSPNEQPIRFVATLAEGQRMLISVPQPAGQPLLDLEILHKGDALLVSDPVTGPAWDSKFDLLNLPPLVSASRK